MTSLRTFEDLEREDSKLPDFVYNKATDKCYHFLTECAKFGEAECLCREMNANLTAIQTKTENEIIYDLAQLNFPVEQNHFWLGARVALTDPSQYDSCVAASLARNQWVAGTCAECFHFLCGAKREQITCSQGITTSTRPTPVTREPTLPNSYLNNRLVSVHVRRSRLGTTKPNASKK
ncbi:hypothetical protein L596_017908 [Steinernema carpocapsae]|uniref:C-type lectin domain-containing protein n=1 Tax=Steinernema carpocapsae TaxID=34508 RepID=A0A4U5N3D1_STECR|nr:hypothetical protein L596_017908 [Steinernema carpocapsae]